MNTEKIVCHSEDSFPEAMNSLSIAGTRYRIIPPHKQITYIVMCQRLSVFHISEAIKQVGVSGELCAKSNYVGLMQRMYPLTVHNQTYASYFYILLQFS
jgi:hypothetical protein